jgi:hypothetical protein
VSSDLEIKSALQPTQNGSIDRKVATLMDNEKLLVQTVLNSWKLVNQRISTLIVQFSEKQLQDQIAPDRNRVLYIIGHLTVVSDLMFPLLGVGERRFSNLDTVYLEHPDCMEVDPLAPAELKAAWQDVTTRMTYALEAFTPEDWLQKHTSVSDVEFEKDPVRNRMAVVLSRTNHISYHTGQLVLAQNSRR